MIIIHHDSKVAVFRSTWHCRRADAINNFATIFFLSSLPNDSGPTTKQVVKTPHRLNDNSCFDRPLRKEKQRFDVDFSRNV
jgi:hypothetical protein